MNGALTTASSACALDRNLHRVLTREHPQRLVQPVAILRPRRRGQTLDENHRLMRSNPNMHWLGWVVIAFALLVGGWLAFDGAHALSTGDYVTPSSGPHEGQLGPWSQFVSAIGIEPRSGMMKAIHLGLGVVWLGVTLCFALRKPWAWKGMLACAILALWYLPFGTLLGIAQIVLLLLPPLRSTERSPG